MACKKIRQAGYCTQADFEVLAYRLWQPSISIVVVINHVFYKPSDLDADCFSHMQVIQRSNLLESITKCNLYYDPYFHALKGVVHLYDSIQNHERKAQKYNRSGLNQYIYSIDRHHC